MHENKKESGEKENRLVARLLRDVLASAPFETLADLADALKFRSAALRIRITNDDINRGLWLVGSNRDLVSQQRALPAPDTRRSSGPPLNRSEASQIHGQVWARWLAEKA